MNIKVAYGGETCSDECGTEFTGVGSGNAGGAMLGMRSVVPDPHFVHN